MDNKREAELEAEIAEANRILTGGILEWLYGTDVKLQQRRDYWEAVRLKAEEQLYNIRNGDTSCQPTTAD